MKSSTFETPLGPMLAIADENGLYLLEFADQRGEKKPSAIPGRTQPIDQIETELNLYFNSQLTQFKTPLHIIGTPFQKRVWEELQKIPYSETLSYLELAIAVGNPSACRAVAQANGANPFAIIIPCHRVINSTGAIGGYGGGIPRKKWLLSHEKAHI